MLQRGRPTRGIDAEPEHDLSAGALQVDRVRALVELEAVALIGAGAAARLRALDHHYPEALALDRLGLRSRQPRARRALLPTTTMSALVTVMSALRSMPVVTNLDGQL